MATAGWISAGRFARGTIWSGRARVARLRHSGHQVYCPCCGSWQSSFRDCVLPGRQCWACGSLERHRSIALWLEARPELLRAGMSILHVAPERALARRLRRVPHVQYLSGDLEGALGRRVLDVTALDYPDESFDAIICNHVLEHVPDDRRAMRELCRVLRPGGWALLLVPDVSAPVTAEDLAVTDPQERQRLYGQGDHVRRYGWDYVDRLTEAGFAVEVERPEQRITQELIERCRLRKFGEVEPLFIGHKPEPSGPR